MNWSGNISKPTRLAEWRSLTKRISTPRSVHPCANYKTTPRKSVPSIKSHPSNTLHEVNLLMDRLIKSELITPPPRLSSDSTNWRKSEQPFKAVKKVLTLTG